MEHSDKERPTVNRPISRFQLAALIVLVTGGLFFLAFVTQHWAKRNLEDRPTNTRSYKLTPKQYEDNTRRAREHSVAQPAQQSALQQNQKIEDCLRSHQCVFQLRGEATPQPVMSFIVAKEVWETFNETDKEDLRSQLKKKIAEAKARPDLYADVPSSAPFYRKALDNIRNTNTYSVILSEQPSPSGALSISQEILINF